MPWLAHSLKRPLTPALPCPLACSLAPLLVRQLVAGLFLVPRLARSPAHPLVSRCLLASYTPWLAHSLKRPSVLALPCPLACSLVLLAARCSLVRGGLLAGITAGAFSCASAGYLGASLHLVRHGWRALLSARWCQRCLVRWLVRLRQCFFAGLFAGAMAGALSCECAGVSVTPPRVLLAAGQRSLSCARWCQLCLVRLLVRRWFASATGGVFSCASAGVSVTPCVVLDAT